MPSWMYDYPEPIGERVVDMGTTCKVCGGHIFETDPALSEAEGFKVWSHVEDTKCDDPTPVTKSDEGSHYAMDERYDGSQYRNHAVGCTDDYNHPGSCVIDNGQFTLPPLEDVVLTVVEPDPDFKFPSNVICRTFFDPENTGKCADCGQDMKPNHNEISYGPVMNDDFTPTEVTKTFMRETGRRIGWVVIDDGGLRLEID